jgi:type 1 glutamine amidotransferase
VKTVRRIILLLLAAVWMCQSHSSQAQPTGVELEKIRAAVPAQPTVSASQPRRLLVFSKAWGYKHSAIPYGQAAFRLMAEKTKAFEAVISDDEAMFEADALSRFDAVLLNNSNNEVFLPEPEEFKRLSPERQNQARARDARLKQNFVEFLRSGQGLAVLHAGVASFREWPEYGVIIGARFDNHPWNEGSTVTLKMTDPGHPLTKAFGREPYVIQDEIYQFKEYRRDRLRVLFGVDVARTDFSKVQKAIRRTDGDFALAWVKEYGAGRVFYSALGHQHDLYWNPVVLQHFLDGIQFALGDLAAPTGPLP